ncbi:UTRA domain-containing protein [Streptomyces sp. NPDC006530]|uniref:UTRA domain-containing protein n=1 Tax=Streptomyces sp. NPDC006530 TaxID=3364750 RepID=UPI0036A5AD53
MKKATYVGGGHMAVDRDAPKVMSHVTVRSTKILARSDMASLLKVPLHSPLTELRCVGYEDETPHSLIHFYVPRVLAPANPRTSVPSWGSIETSLAELRPALADTLEEVDARLPTRSEAAILRISTAQPILAITRVSTDITGRVAEAAHLVLPGDRADALFVTHRMATERPESTTQHDELRLLPWSDPDGKPCFLSTDDPASHLSRLADATEAHQLSEAAALLARVRELISNDRTRRPTLKRLATALAEALQATLGVATSRGHRLTMAHQTPLGRDGLQRRPAETLDQQ